MAQASLEEANKMKFLQNNITDNFDEQKARTLFELYCVQGQKGTKLEAPDIRQMLFDLFSVANAPLVVPDESLENVLASMLFGNLDHEKKSSVTWEQFREFFMVTDTPLQKMMLKSVENLDRAALNNAVLVSLQPVESLEYELYDRNFFVQSVNKIIPNAALVFVYFVRSGDILSLVCVNGELPSIGSISTLINNMKYTVNIQRFDVQSDIFPPFTRSGGVQTQVARALADTYVKAKSWDESHYQLQEKITNVAKKAVSTAKEFDETHQITAKIQTKANELDEKYQLSDKATTASQKAEEAFQKLNENPRIQSAAQKLSNFVGSVARFIDSVNKETTQLVVERRASDAERSAPTISSVIVSSETNQQQNTCEN